MNEMLDPRKTFGEAVIEAAKKNPDIVVLSADSGSGSGLKDFPSLFPAERTAMKDIWKVAAGS